MRFKPGFRLVIQGMAHRERLKTSFLFYYQASYEKLREVRPVVIGPVVGMATSQLRTEALFQVEQCVMWAVQGALDV